MPIRNFQNTSRLLYWGRSPVPRFFNLPQAEELLPEVERLIRNLVQAKQEYDAGDEELEALKQRITLLGGFGARLATGCLHPERAKTRQRVP